jgi:glycosyltransferase involved in cell wall biosynthesis
VDGRHEVELYISLREISVIEWGSIWRDFAMKESSSSEERGSALSLVIPAYNEEAGIGPVLDQALDILGGLGIEFEIIVVDDCSTDSTAAIATSKTCRVITNLQNSGYGYSLVRGIRAARYPSIAICDADGSYPIGALPQLVEEHRRGMAMVVGQRQGAQYIGSMRMRMLRWLFRAFTEFVAGRSIPDVNSGFRVFDRQAVLPLFPHISYGFSFTTSITLLFMMRALPVSYIPIEYHQRRGASKVRYWRDSLRALQIIASITARLNPIKLFLFAAVVNVLIMLPILGLLSLFGGVVGATTLVLETSAILVGLGLAVEALIDKSPFEQGDRGESRES